MSCQAKLLYCNATISQCNQGVVLNHELFYSFKTPLIAQNLFEAILQAAETKLS